jgi:selenium metabolism protein YedF
MNSIEIDVRGKPCPLPVIEAKKALRRAEKGAVVKVLVDNDIARQNLEKMARGLLCPYGVTEKEGGLFEVAITAAPAQAASGGGAGLTVAFGKNTMGAGNDELGAVLIKGFIYSLTQLEKPPENLLFFNSGVKLTTGDSAVIQDLKALEEKGTIVSSCGTCLDFYKLKDSLRAGSVTNMYAILEAMSQAERLINLN